MPLGWPLTGNRPDSLAPGLFGGRQHTAQDIYLVLIGSCAIVESSQAAHQFAGIIRIQKVELDQHTFEVFEIALQFLSTAEMEIEGRELTQEEGAYSTFDSSAGGEAAPEISVPVGGETREEEAGEAEAEPEEEAAAESDAEPEEEAETDEGQESDDERHRRTVDGATDRRGDAETVAPHPRCTGASRQSSHVVHG